MKNILLLDKEINELSSNARQIQTLDNSIRAFMAQTLEETQNLLNSVRIDGIVMGACFGQDFLNSLVTMLVERDQSIPLILICSPEKAEDIVLPDNHRNADFFSTNGSVVNHEELVKFINTKVNEQVSRVFATDNVNNLSRFEYDKNSRSILFDTSLRSQDVKAITEVELAEDFEESQNFHQWVLQLDGFSRERAEEAYEKAKRGFTVRVHIPAPLESEEGFFWNISMTPEDDNKEGNQFVRMQIEVEHGFSDSTDGALTTTHSKLRMFGKIFEKTVEGVTVTDTKGTILQVNPTFSAITGYTPEEVIGKNPRILKSGRHDDAFYETMWNSLQKRGEWSGEIWNRRKDGVAYPEWLNIFAIKDEYGKTTNYIGMLHDLTEIKQSREQIEFKTYHDSLTGLPNRTSFSANLRRAIAKATRSKTILSLLVLDIDNFKQINESYGHPAGDKIVQQLAERLKQCIRSDDTMARIGGDEFAILCEDIDSINDVANLAGRIQVRMKEPMILDDQEIFASFSIGITIYPQDGLTESELMKNADMALFKAKELGKKQFFFYTSNLHDRILRRMELESNLRRALYNNEFSMHYQPKIDSISGRIAGFESLMRWNSPKQGFIPPDEFIPILEEIDYITEVGLWALETSCQDIKSLHDHGYDDLTVAVNLSAKQFEDPVLLKSLERILYRTNFPGDRLILEITEGTIMNNVEHAIEIMESFSKLGVHISIDDFGTGYSSLSYLKRFPVDELKIDRSFVADIPENAEDMAISRAIVSLAKSLDLSVVAEGVETRDQKEFFTDLGCKGLQGYLFSKPVSFKSLAPLLEKYNSQVH